MVDMRMSQYDAVNFRRLNHSVAVHSIGLQTLALKHSTVEQQLLTLVGDNEMFAACYLTRCAYKLDFHYLITFKTFTTLPFSVMTLMMYIPLSNALMSITTLSLSTV